MNLLKSKKGFTLIELLIVITIIGILAVAFLPTLLGAPAKARDTKRVADLQTIQKILVNANLEGKAYPTTIGCVEGALSTGLASPNDTWVKAFGPSFGGVVPTDPQATNGANVQSSNCSVTPGFGKYNYVKFASGGAYTFGLYAKMEQTTSGNATCSELLASNIDVTPDAAVKDCYAILVQ
ncbi:MAG: prepilin-type N-terminal cleavage/methylation domain-containing protein [Candidatus Gracilibacteria bacterium]